MDGLFPDDAFPNDTPEDKARNKCHVHARTCFTRTITMFTVFQYKYVYTKFHLDWLLCE